MAFVSKIFVSVRSRQPARELESVTAITEAGLDGSRHNRPRGKRQALLMDSETLEVFKLAPGQIKENITTSGLALGELLSGQRLEIGQAILEVTGPCDPCTRMDEIRVGLREALQGKRGVLCRVIQGGTICRGDTIDVLATAKSSPESGG